MAKRWSSDLASKIKLRHEIAVMSESKESACQFVLTGFAQPPQALTCNILILE